MKYRGVIYDLDGTLLDTTEGILESVKHTANLLRYSELPKEILLKFIGPPIQESFKNFYNCTSEESQNAANIFRDYYKNHSLLKAKPYDGIYELCERLKNNEIKQAVATYKREDYAIKLLMHFGFHNYMNVMHGADNSNHLTKADIINLCLKKMNIKSKECVLIGDTHKDAIGAMQSGIDFIGVTYGFGFKTKDEANQYSNVGVVDSIEELMKLFD